MSIEQRMLWNAARAYIMLAKSLRDNNIECRHYLLKAKECLNKYHLLGYDDDITVMMVA